MEQQFSQGRLAYPKMADNPAQKADKYQQLADRLEGMLSVYVNGLIKTHAAAKAGDAQLSIWDETKLARERFRTALGDALRETAGGRTGYSTE